MHELEPTIELEANQHSACQWHVVLHDDGIPRRCCVINRKVVASYKFTRGRCSSESRARISKPLIQFDDSSQ